MNKRSLQKAGLDGVSPLAWVVANNFVNETQVPIEFTSHRFLLEPFADLHPDQVVKKSAQVGFSVTAILKSIWLAKYMGLNIIYALPTNDIIKGFVQPKVDTLISSNHLISSMMTNDSVSLKQIGQRFIHFKGTGSQREAISTSADLLVVDEYDRALDMSVVNTFDSRLQASEFAWRWRFSNPSGVGFGVDSLYTDSDQMHWLITCPHCSHESYIDWEREVDNHFINVELATYACGACGLALDDESRQNGRWVALYPDRARRGYWISQLMAPWVSAARIIEQKNESSIDFFYNFVLGKAYTPSDLIVNRETILRACAPSIIPKLGVALGVDQNAEEQIWVAATSQGVFGHGKAHSWEEIEHMKLQWNAVVVVDPAPYPTMPKAMAEKYHDWYLCYFRESKELGVLSWKNSIVYADRTRLLDIVANEITEAKLLFREHPYALEDYIADWQNLYRTTVEESDGRTKSKWLKKDNKESDYSLATAYMRIALSRTIDGESSFIEPSFNPSSGVRTDVVVDNGELQTSLNAAIDETLSQFD